RKAIELRRLNPFIPFFQLLENRKLIILVFIFFLLYFSTNTYATIWPYYTQYKFHWRPIDIGLSFSIYGIFAIFVQSVIIRFVKNYICEQNILILGVALNITAMCIIIFSQSIIMLYVSILFMSLALIGGPVLYKKISCVVQEKSLGETQGILSSTLALSSVLSPVFMTQLFKYFTKPDFYINFPSAPFAISGIILIFVLYIIVSCKL
ncbi:MFS transporter, partial [Roseibium sp. RKSG952]|uniref:MFS transporter n=1 Tax=Roseibium sp. RKSG952 TaxID=2529384 RepID=UPI0012BCFF36